MTMTGASPMTADEYLAQDDDPADAFRRQLIDGRVVENHPGIRHQRIVGDLAASLYCFEEQSDDGHMCLPLNVKLDEYNVFAPDVLWVSDPAQLDAEWLLEPPDLAVEVRSPGTWCHDIGVKKSRYEQRGLPELWLVDTFGKVVLVYRRSVPEMPTFDVELEFAADGVLTSPQLPGFELDLGDLFPDD